MIKHWIRLGASICGRFKPSHPLWPKGRKSPYKGYWFELGHSLKNIPVEYLRAWGIWDRPSGADGR